VVKKAIEDRRGHDLVIEDLAQPRNLLLLFTMRLARS
jgi:hypothetical protein